VPTIRRLLSNPRLASRPGRKLRVTCLWKADVEVVPVRYAENVTFERWSDVLRVVEGLLAPHAPRTPNRSQPRVEAGEVRLVGWSRGGSIALRAAIEYPDRVGRVALLAPSSPPWSADLSRVQCPVRIWHARRDAVVPFAVARRIQSSVHGSTLSTMGRGDDDTHACRAFASACASWICATGRRPAEVLPQKKNRIAVKLITTS